MKSRKLVGLTKHGGWYHADLYNRQGGYYEWQRFLYYTKAQVIAKLRSEYDTVVPRHFERRLQHD